MRTLSVSLRWMPGLVLLASCTSPPTPPTVDESSKRPVNSAMAVELQVCRNDLYNTRLMAAESGRLADSTAATLASLAARQQVLAALQSPALESSPDTARASTATSQPNTLYTVHFEFGSKRVEIPADVARPLTEQAKAAPLVLLRGRTDGATDSPSEARIARDRAVAVRDYLVAAGVDPSRIRTTHQPAGDHVADNDSPSGRQLNRRVEIELYRSLPVALGTGGAAQP